MKLCPECKGHGTALIVSNHVPPPRRAGGPRPPEGPWSRTVPCSECDGRGVVAVPPRPKSTTPCKECGDVGYSLDWCRAAREELERRGCCFTCCHWLTLIEQGGNVVVEGNHYLLGPEVPYMLPIARGFGGRHVCIRFFDGRGVCSSNLWHQGAIPERFRERLPDNAVFIHGPVGGSYGQPRMEGEGQLVPEPSNPSALLTGPCAQCRKITGRMCYCRRWSCPDCHCSHSTAPEEEP